MPPRKKRSSRRREEETNDHDEVVGQDFFHPSTDKPARKEEEDDLDEEGADTTRDPKMNEGEIEVQGEGKYCEKRCFCCTCWTVMLVVILCFAIMAAQFYMLNGTLPGMENLPGGFLGGDSSADADSSATASVAPAGPKPWENSNGFEWDIGAAADSDVDQPTIVRTLEFGNSGLAWDAEFPGEDYKIRVPADRSTSVTTISIKRDKSTQNLSGIQMAYSDGNESPTFDNASSTLNGQMPITLSEFSSVRKISMAVSSGNGIVAMKLYDGKDNELVSKLWATVSGKTLKKMWVTKNIAADEKIIGFKVSTAGDYIARFGWQLM